MPLYNRRRLQEELDIVDKAEMAISGEILEHRINGFQAQQLQYELDRHRKSLKFRVVRVAEAQSNLKQAQSLYGDASEEANLAMMRLLFLRYCEICGHFPQNKPFTKDCVICGSPLKGIPRDVTSDVPTGPTMRKLTDNEVEILEAWDIPVTKIGKLNGKVACYVWLK